MRVVSTNGWKRESDFRDGIKESDEFEQQRQVDMAFPEIDAVEVQRALRDKRF